MFTGRVMVKDLEVLDLMFKQYFDSGKNNYAVKVVGLDTDKSNIDVNLTFLSEEKYCCCEVTCHFKAEWERIRELALRSSVVLSKPLAVNFNVSVEAGAIFEIPVVNNSETAKSFNYQERFSE